MHQINRRQLIKTTVLFTPAATYSVFPARNVHGDTHQEHIHFGQRVFAHDASVFGLNLYRVNRDIDPTSGTTTHQKIENPDVRSIFGGLLRNSLNPNDNDDPTSWKYANDSHPVERAADALMLDPLTVNSFLTNNSMEIYWIRLNPWGVIFKTIIGSTPIAYILKPFFDGFLEETGHQFSKWLFEDACE